MASRFGGFEFDLSSRELRKGRTRLRVPDQSLAILAMCRGIASWYRVDGPLTPAELADLYLTYSLRLAGHPDPAQDAESSSAAQISTNSRPDKTMTPS